MSMRHKTPPADLAAFVEILRQLPQHDHSALRNFFESESGIVVARAPGRLDVMGGIADYSGSLVLQRPTAEATFAAVQMAARPAVQIVSLDGDAPSLRMFSVDLKSLSPDGRPIEYAAAQALFRKETWAAYAAGVFLVLMRERGVTFSRGSKILV